MAPVGDEGAVVEVRPAQLIEADNGKGVVPAGDVQDSSDLWGLQRKSATAGRLSGVGVAGEETLREGDDGSPRGVGLLQTFLKAFEVVIKVSAPGLKLAVRDFHEKRTGWSVWLLQGALRR